MRSLLLPCLRPSSLTWFRPSSRYISAARGALNDKQKERGVVQRKIGEFMKKKETPPPELMEEKKKAEVDIAALETKEKELIKLRDETIGKIGNLVPDSVPVDDDEDNNLVVDTYGSFEREEWMLSHYDLVQLAGMANTVKGSTVAGSRGYFLLGAGMRLNQALISYAVQFLAERGSTMVQTPFVMNQSLMGKVAQLGDFDEQLYKVSGAGEDQYLIATSEQPLCGYHLDEWIDPKTLPHKYAGYSTCFRKEAGSHGRDQAGIFRVHQFEKVEQFVVTSPDGNDSWDMQEAMINNCKEFYQSLGIPYRVVNIVSGALNDAAAKKYDLEAWFPGSNAHRELVSCSNCTDYQSRRLEVRYGTSGKSDDGTKKYVHMLNSTLIATERAMCCVLENYQTKGGIRVPEVLQEYMGGVSFIPFVTTMPKPKKGPAPPQYVPTKEQIAELDEGRTELQAYMDKIAPAISKALNQIAKERPDNALQALADLLGKAAGGGGGASSGAGGASGSDFDLKAFEAAELKKKQEAERKKAEEQDKRDAENARRDAEIAAKGKRAAGGVHKFDPDEVDVHGGNATADDFLDAFGFGDDVGGAAEEDVSDAASGGDISYADELKKHLTGALNDVLAKQPSDPFRAMQQTLFQASLSGADALTAVTEVTPEVTAYEAKYGLYVSVDDVLFKMKKRLVVGPKDGFKFLLSDAGDVYTELSKRLKAMGGDLGLGMTAEELAEKDRQAAKAKREKEAKAEAERDAADAANAARAAALEASGKKATGGLHKFDASEVDVHGGDATADDFLDAFGF